MTPYGDVEKRYGFAVPESYRTLHEQGHLALPWENYLVFYDVEWLPLKKMADYQFLDWQIGTEGGIVPFAISARRDEWCWRLDWADRGEAPVVFCERGPEGTGYAPHFRGFLYRKALEEFGGFNDLGDDGSKLADLQRAVKIIAPLLPAHWGKQLRELASHDLDEWSEDDDGNLCILPGDELTAIIKSELAFPHLDETFIQDKEYAKRLQK